MFLCTLSVLNFILFLLETFVATIGTIQVWFLFCFMYGYHISPPLLAPLELPATIHYLHHIRDSLIVLLIWNWHLSSTQQDRSLKIIDEMEINFIVAVIVKVCTQSLWSWNKWNFTSLVSCIDKFNSLIFLMF